MVYVLQTLFGAVAFLLIAISISIIINIIFVKDFRILINKIKRVIFSNQQVNKITQIKILVSKYFFD